MNSAGHLSWGYTRRVLPSTRPSAPPSSAAARETATLTVAQWQQAERAHELRADALSAAHRARRSRGERHPVEDFLWTYYPTKPGELRRWHPGAGIRLIGAVDRSSWRYYHAVGPTDAGSVGATADANTPGKSTTSAESPVAGAGAVTLDLESYFAKRGPTVDYVELLLGNTMSRAPRFGCFGLHEWAMVYRMTPEQLRHTILPLRIGQEATDRVVESHPIACSHFDAFRFFTPEASPLNELQPTRETQPDFEQAGCLHAGMDLYKWATKLGPIIPGELLLDTFEFARDIREVDMRASPYDVSAYTGVNGEPLRAIPIETPEGKREYAGLQRGFAERGNVLRHRMLDAIAHARAARP